MMPPFYTRSGDDGYTGLLGDERVPKYHPRPEAVGDLDEASAALGMARAACRTSQTAEMTQQAQRDLYQLMAEISALPANAALFRRIDADRVDWLEKQIDAILGQITLPDEFILPGDSTAGACLALARTVVRRAERRVVRLYHEHELENPYLLSYLNRLSSLCFVLEILEDQASGVAAPTLAKQGE